MDNRPAGAYRSPMDYPTVRVRLGDDAATTTTRPEVEVDIVPKPDDATLVTESSSERDPDEPVVQSLPNWMLSPG